MRKDLGKDNVCYVHVVPLLYMEASGEFKTKAIQLSTRQLREAGIQPNILVTRCPKPMPQELKPKISLYTDVEESDIIEAIDARTIYEVPLLFEKQGLKEKIETVLNLQKTTTNLATWESFVNNIVAPKQEIHIAIIGKYAELEDAYMSVREALVHAGAHHATKVHRHWINSEEIEKDVGLLDRLVAEGKMQGLIIPGGFGSRGIEGKITAIKYAREHDIPFLGICLGLQLAVIEFARNVCGISDATSTEFETPGTLFVEYLPDQNDTIDKGGTLRLGHQEAQVAEGTLIHKLYGTTTISDRHRHRYEVSLDKHDILRQHGLVLSGTSHNGRLVEYIENPKCTYFVATQAHPEFKSRPEKPHPLFDGLVEAVVRK